LIDVGSENVLPCLTSLYLFSKGLEVSPRIDTRFNSCDINQKNVLGKFSKTCRIFPHVKTWMTARQRKMNRSIK